MRTGVLVATGAGLVALSVADAAYRIRNWGAADAEVTAVLAGDEIVPEPADSTTIAVGVAAPADDVWQALLAAVADGSTARTRPGRSIVLDEGPEAVRSFHVVPTAPGRCRLLARTRVARGGAAGRVAAVAVDPVVVLRARRLLLRVADRAEAGVRTGAAVHAATAVPVEETARSRTAVTTVRCAVTRPG